MIHHICLSMDYNEGNRMFKISLVLCNNAHLDILGSEMTLICIVSCDLDLRAIHAPHKSIQHPKNPKFHFKNIEIALFLPTICCLLFVGDVRAGLLSTMPVKTNPHP